MQRLVEGKIPSIPILNIAQGSGLDEKGRVSRIPAREAKLFGIVKERSGGM